MIAALLVSSSINYCSDSNDSVKASLLDHPHLFRNGLLSMLVGNLGMCFWRQSLLEPYLFLRTDKSLSSHVIFVSSAIAFRVTYAAVLGDCIDVERARSKRIEDMLKGKQ